MRQAFITLFSPSPWATILRIEVWLIKSYDILMDRIKRSKSTKRNDSDKM